MAIAIAQRKYLKVVWLHGHSSMIYVPTCSMQQGGFMHQLADKSAATNMCDFSIIYPTENGIRIEQTLSRVCVDYFLDQSKGRDKYTKYK